MIPGDPNDIFRTLMNSNYSNMAARAARLNAYNNYNNMAYPPDNFEFREGDRVVLLKGSGRDSTESNNPIWGEKGIYIAGYVVEVSGNVGVIHWDNGSQNMYRHGKDQYKIVRLEEAPTPKKPKHIKLDSTKLDPLVIDSEARDEIVAVLKQMQNHDKLFGEWGLGEVLEYGKGMTFMFYGPPGTGKTWGATCMAKALGTTLLTISAAEIQSSEPGGANRSIQNAFKTAQEEGKVLFIDECDSLITSRNELGMILSSEVNTLLTEIEKTEGVVILATNKIENMDEALERRISLIVEFPAPDFENRKKIWAKLLPKKMPLAKDVKIELLAEEAFTGGQIKNVVLQAARMALATESTEVNLSHFKAAFTRLKSSKNLMGTGSRYRQGRVKDYGVGESNGLKQYLKSNIDKDVEIDVDVEKKKKS